MMFKNPFKLSTETRGVESQDVHGSFFKWFYRKPSLPIARLLSKTRITPNQVTVLGFIIKLVAAFFYSLGSFPYFIFGSVILYISILFDFIDGSLARIKGMQSKRGEFLDKILDDIGKNALFLAIMYGLYTNTGDYLVWVFGFLAITSSLMMSFMHALFQWLFPEAPRIIESEKKGRFFVRHFSYIEPFIYNMMILFGLFGKLYWYLVICGIYGWIFMAGSFFIILRKTGKII
ncbi:hypothetical protein CMO89_04820 [Candidatus Woesearchaeota archaeon]|nr:hypothetical protein [Candidatus Woesearchaeota archaeon]|tara:strand:+ start:683 stop:1381 length:699 start_codon:yes stop_codon:yes gene_type:complete